MEPMTLQETQQCIPQQILIGAAGLNGAVSGGLANHASEGRTDRVQHHHPQLADTALDTIPTEIQNYNNGMTVPQLAKYAAINQGTNLAYNIGGEAIGQGLKALGNLNAARKAVNQVPSASIPSVSDAATRTYDAAKGTLKMQMVLNMTSLET